MKISIHAALAVVLILGRFNNAGAVSSAEVGAQFLEMSPSPRAASMGDAYVSQSKSADSIFYNPASSVFVPDFSLSGSYLRWFEGINYLSLFASIPLVRSMAMGLGVLGLTTGGIPETMGTGSGGIGLSGDDFSAADFCGLLNFSWMFFPGLSAGASMKFISQSLSSAQSFSFGSDVGLLFHLKNTGFDAGFAVQNLGTPAQFVTYRSGLPLSFKLGASYDLDLSRRGNFLKSLLFAGEVGKTAGETIAASVGMEGVFWGILMLRGGYQYQGYSDSAGFSTGIGFHFARFNSSFAVKKVQINYSLGFFNNLGLTHAFQVNTAFQSGTGSGDQATIDDRDQTIADRDRTITGMDRKYRLLYEKNKKDEVAALKKAYDLSAQIDSLEKRINLSGENLPIGSAEEQDRRRKELDEIAVLKRQFELERARAERLQRENEELALQVDSDQLKSDAVLAIANATAMKVKAETWDVKTSAAKLFAKGERSLALAKQKLNEKNYLEASTTGIMAAIEYNDAITTANRRYTDETERLAKAREEIKTFFSGLEDTEVTDENGLVRIVIRGALFEFNKAVLRERYHGPLDRLAEILARYEEFPVSVEGHSDDIGMASYNLKLSSQRAGAITTYLIDKGRVGSDRVVALGYGMSRPLATNGTDSGRARNRRVEIILQRSYPDRDKYKADNRNE